jgi:hypothetical protein
MSTKLKILQLVFLNNIDQTIFPKLLSMTIPPAHLVAGE